MLKKTANEIIDKLMITVESGINSDLPPGRIGDKVKRASIKAQEELKSISGSIFSYRSYCSKVRRLIKNQGIKHHAIDYNIKKMARKTDKHRDEIISWIDLPAQEIEKRVKALRGKSGSKALDSELYEFKVYSIAYYIVKMTKDEYELASGKQEKKLAEKYDNDNIISINPSVIAEIAKKLLFDSNKYKKILGIGLATGRRLNEITYSGEFTAIDKNKISFSGNLKGGEEKRDMDIIIYSLVDAELVESAVNEVREDKVILDLALRADQIRENEGITAALKVVNNTCGSSANRITKSVLKVISDSKNWVFKDSRAMWTRCAVEMFFNDWESNNKGQTPTEFIKEQLCHENYSTQMNYKSFIVTDSIIDISEAIQDKKTENRLSNDSLEFDSFEEISKFLESKNHLFEKSKEKDLKNVHFRVKNYIAWRLGNPMEGETTEYSLNLRDIGKKVSNGGIGIGKEKASEYWEMINDGREEKNTISKEEKECKQGEE